MRSFIASSEERNASLLGSPERRRIKGLIPRGSAARCTSEVSHDNTSGLAPRNLYFFLNYEKKDFAIEELPEFDGHKTASFFHDADTGLRGFIAIHNTNLGPATGKLEIPR